MFVFPYRSKDTSLKLRQRYREKQHENDNVLIYSVFNKIREQIENVIEHNDAPYVFIDTYTFAEFLKKIEEKSTLFYNLSTQLKNQGVEIDLSKPGEIKIIF